jgi:dynamin 1-like protein
MNFTAIDKNNMGPVILHLISRFIEEYNKKLDGTFVRDITSECLGGARINFIFHRIFKNAIMKIDPFENLTETDIQTAIKNASAMSPSLFVPEQAFEVLTRQQIARLLEPSIECA